MNAFETEIFATFPSYESQGVAHLSIMFPPMRVAGQNGHMPCYIPVGKADYDAGGYYLKDAVTIGVELKETTDHENSLSIVHPDRKGSGLQYHQLKALCDLDDNGGMALLLWSNGGEIGVARGSVLQVALRMYDMAMAVEDMRKTPARGAKSILWGHFQKVQRGPTDKPMWLPSLKEAMLP